MDIGVIIPVCPFKVKSSQIAFNKERDIRTEKTKDIQKTYKNIQITHEYKLHSQMHGNS